MSASSELKGICAALGTAPALLGAWSPAAAEFEAAAAEFVAAPLPPLSSA